MVIENVMMDSQFESLLRLPEVYRISQLAGHNTGKACENLYGAKKSFPIV